MSQHFRRCGRMINRHKPTMTTRPASFQGGRGGLLQQHTLQYDQRELDNLFRSCRASLDQTRKGTEQRPTLTFLCVAHNGSLPTRGWSLLAMKLNCFLTIVSPNVSNISSRVVRYSVSRFHRLRAEVGRVCAFPCYTALRSSRRLVQCSIVIRIGLRDTPYNYLAGSKTRLFASPWRLSVVFAVGVIAIVSAMC